MIFLARSLSRSPLAAVAAAVVFVVGGMLGQGVHAIGVAGNGPADAGRILPMAQLFPGPLQLAQAPELPNLTPGAVPTYRAPSTVVPQNPSDSRIPNIGSGGGTLGRPSAIQDPLGYDDSSYFRRQNVPRPPPVVLPEPSRRAEPPPRSSSPPALRRVPKKKPTQAQEDD